MILHLITYFFAAGTWPHSVDINYVCNLLCCVFWRSSKMKITLCHIVLISIGTFIIVTPKSLVGPNALRFFKGFKFYPIWACFHGVGRRCNSGSVSDGTPAFMAWRWGSRDNLFSAIPLRPRYASSLKHTNKSGGTTHCQSLWHLPAVQCNGLGVVKIVLRVLETYSVSRSHRPPYVRM